MKLTFRNLGLASVFLSLAVCTPAIAGEISLLTEALPPDKDASYRCSAIEALASAKDDFAGKEIAGLLSDTDQTVRACAIRALRGAGAGKNDAAAEALLAEVDNYQAASSIKGLYENNIKARLRAIDSVWALGEIGDPRLMPKLAEFYTGADDVIKINLIVSMGKLEKNEKSGPFLYSIAADPRETEVVRAAAFEMLEHIGSPAAVPGLAPSQNIGMEKGDLIFTGGIVGTISGWVSPDMPVGHSGIFAGTETRDGRIRVLIADCVPSFFVPGDVRNIDSWHKFTRQYEFPFYGNRTSKVRPTPAQRDRIVKRALAMGKLGLKYKLFRKGPLKYDCVNYTEFLYEEAGLNPTPDSYESGAGWPFTPWEQFEATSPAAPVPGPLRLPKVGMSIAPDPGIIARGIGSLTGAFGMKSAQASEVNIDIQPEAVN